MNFSIPSVYKPWLGALMIMLFLMFLVLSFYPANAATMTERETIISRYKMNPVYLKSSAMPGSHTVYNITLDLMLMPGVDRAYIEQSLIGINPFYKFRFVDPDPSAYRKENGLYYSHRENTVVISLNPLGLCTKCGCYTTGQCCPISLWIYPGMIPTPEQFGKIIEHECDHLIGRVNEKRATPEQIRITSEELTAAYTDSSRTWGNVIINRITGSGSVSWSVTI